jgi:hypothetical protein
MIRKIAQLAAGAQPVALSVAGLGCLSGAAYVVNLAAGLAATGVSLLLLEWRVTS